MYHVIVGVLDSGTDIIKICFDVQSASIRAQNELNKIYNTRFLIPRYEYELVKVLSFNSDGEHYNTVYYRRKNE